MNNNKPPRLSKIYNLKNVRHLFEKFNNIHDIEYKFKYKLDGTQAGVYIDKYEVKTFSKNRWLSLENDNGGFHKFIVDNFYDKFKSLFNIYKVNDFSKIVVLGEYIGITGGKNYLKKTLKGETYFCVFLIKIDNLIIYEPELIKDILFKDEKIKTIPYITDENKENITFNIYFEGNSLISNEHNMEDIILNLEKEDSLLKYWFSISVPGEGLVGYPIYTSVPVNMYYDFMFKIKTPIYKLNQKQNKLQSSVENYKDYEDFVNDFLTENRLNQGFQEVCNSVYDVKLTEEFLKWISEDVLKESELEREQNNLTDKKTINKIVNRKAKTWYFNKENEITI